MKYEIYSGDWQLDTIEDPISLTFKIDDIEDITKKDTSYSKEILFPGTPTNNRFFGHLYDVNILTGSFNPLKSQPAILKAEDNEIMKGALQLIEVILRDGAVEYSCQLVSNFTNLITQTKDLTLANLDMSEWNHIRDKANIAASWNREVGKGYVYPYIANGNEMAKWSSESAIYDLFPAFYFKEIFDKIMTNAGYTYSSRFLDSEYFKRLILPYVEDNLQIDDALVNARTTQVASDGSWVGPNGTTYTDYKGFTSTSLTKGNNRSFSGFKMNVESGSSATFNWQDPLNTFDGDLYTVPNNGFWTLDIVQNIVLAYWSQSNTYIWAGYNYAFRLDYKIEVVRPNGTVRTTLKSLSDEAVIPSNDLNTTRTGLFIDVNGNLGDLVQYAASGIWLNQGEKIRVSGRFRWPDSQNNYFGGNGSDSVIQIYPLMKDIFGSSSSRFICKPTDNSDKGNEELDMSGILPNTIKQSDFILDVFKAFSLIIDDDEVKDNHLIIEPDEDYYNSGGGVKNWNSLIDEGSDIKLQLMSQLDASTWKWKWTKDDDYWNEQYSTETGREYGDYTLAVQNDWSNEEQVTELLFSPTPNAQEFLNGRVAPQFIDRQDATISPRKVNPRILFYGGMIDCEPWKLKDNYDEDPNEVTYTQYPYCGMWDHPTDPRWTLEFSRGPKQYWNTTQLPNNNLYWQFHRYKMQQIQNPDSRFLEALFRLTPNVIANIDWRDQIELHGAYWRINKILDYNPVGNESLTRVSLYKINDILIDATTQTRIVANPSCPIDMVAKKGKDGKWMHHSPSGQPISQNCCNSVGGTWANGICYLPTPYGNTTPFTDTPSVGLAGVNWVSSSEPDGALVSKKNGNTILTPNILVQGSNNFIPQGSSNTVIIGDNNQVAQGISGGLVLGSDKLLTKDNQLIVDYLGEKVASTIKSTAEVTYEELLDMTYRGALVPYTDYLMTDKGIILTAETAETFSPNAKRIQSVVKSSYYSASGTYKGIWVPGGTYAINNSVLYSGKIWRNLTGAAGTATSAFALDSTNWAVTASTAHLTTGVFGVNYDIFGDNVYEQWDNFGNRVKVELNTNSTGQRGYTDVTDWLQPRRYGNVTQGMFNNTSTEIYSNNVKGPIYNNWLAEDIYSNSNLGEISYNQNAGEISFNTNAGSIKGNANAGYISYNNNNGSIQNNPSSVDDIFEAISNK